MKRVLPISLALFAIAAVSIAMLLQPWAVAQQPSGITGVLASSSNKGTVLLIPGHGGDETVLNPLATVLTADGYRVEMVDIGDGSQSIDVYAAQVVQTAAAISGPLSLVGYSQGGLIARAAAQVSPHSFGRIVTIATPHAGTEIAALASAFKVSCSESCEQMVPGSPFLASLTLPVYADRWLALYTNGDEIVRPAESAALPGATNIAMDLACARDFNHYEIVASPFSAEAVSLFIASGKQPAAC